VSGYTHCIVQDPEASNLLWLGTDHGLYYSINYGQTWTKWTQGFPSVPVTDMKIHPREHDLIIGTFGRAAWILDDVRPLRELAKTETKVLDADLAAFPSPDAYLAERRSYQGIRFYADAEYIGQDRPSGALLTVWVKPKKDEEPKEEKAEKPEKSATPGKRGGKGDDKATIKVVNAAGDTIRTFSQPLSPGFNRFTWNLREDGVAFPSRREATPDADPPMGDQVMPGTYTLVIKYGAHRAETRVTVLPDPRIAYEPGTWDNKKAVNAELSEIVKAATAGFDRLRDMRTAIELVEKSMANAPDSTQTQIKAWGKALRDSIATLEELYMEPEDTKGIKRNPNNLGSSLWSVRSYLRSMNGEPSQMVRFAMDNARRQTTEVVTKVNALLAGDFADYRRKIEAMPVTLFKPMDAVRMD
jgi:hypothetical protein